jgi:chromosome segregation ATPase
MMSNRVSEVGSAGAVMGRTPDDIERDVALVAGELQRLRAEQEALASSRSAAAEEQDAWRLEEIDGRAQALREEADAAQARLCRLHAERARAELPEAEAQAVAARAEYARTHAEYLRAYELTNRLGVEADNASMRAERLRQGVADNVRQALELERNLPLRLRGAGVRQS